MELLVAALGWSRSDGRGDTTSVVQNYRNLLVWQKAHTLAVSVKKKTERLRDRTGAVTQARRSALSIPSNIAEGCNRGSNRDFAKFVQVSIGSSSELEYQLEYARDTDVLKRTDANQLLEQVVEVRRMLYGLLKRLREGPDKSKDSAT